MQAAEVVFSCHTQEEWDAFTPTLGDLPLGASIIERDDTIRRVVMAFDVDCTENYVAPHEPHHQPQE